MSRVALLFHPPVVVLSVVVAVVVAASACQPTGAVEVGERLFNDPRVSSSAFNTFSCATCHDIDAPEVEDTADAPIKAGHPLRDVVFRSSWWGGTTPTLKSAVDQCLTFYMRGQPLETESDVSRALYEYLLSVSSRPGEASLEPLPLTIVENVGSLPLGSPSRGSVLYDQACAVCHGAAFTGDGRPSELIAVLPGDSEDFAAASGFPLDVVLIEKVRHGPFFGIGGSMPPYATERLSDEDLGAIVAFLIERP